MTTEITPESPIAHEATVSVSNPSGQLGWIVSWKVPAEIPLSDLRAALIGSGLDPELAGDMRHENALRRGLRDMKESRVIRKLRRDGVNVFFQFTREFLDNSGLEIHYDREAELCLNCETGLVTADVQQIAIQAETLLKEHLAKRLTTDLTRLVQTVYDSASADLIPIREQGGAYFVPSNHDELVEKSRNLLAAIGGKLRSFAVRLGSGDTNECVAESMAEYFVDLVAEFRGKCDGLSTDTRGDVRDRRMESISEMRQKMETYRGLLSGLADRISDEINDAEKGLLEALSRPAAEDEAGNEAGDEEGDGDGEDENGDSRGLDDNQIGEEHPEVAAAL